MDQYVLKSSVMSTLPPHNYGYILSDLYGTLKASVYALLTSKTVKQIKHSMRKWILCSQTCQYNSSR